ncbi:FtsX-like permease family protein [Microbispora catharanthi]|uniref:FtsX-like permease family protein n=1 Tax=Microbispora catharanthi TaxID=1712871 RepID=UPI00137840A4|nr:FtsX-like permease family protein [Microbispora catharanthi]
MVRTRPRASRNWAHRRYRPGRGNRACRPVLVAALAIVAGLGLGVAFAAGTVTALGRTTEATLTLPVGPLLLVVAVAAVAGLPAGLLPARHAARLDVLTAIATS